MIGYGIFAQYYDELIKSDEYSQLLEKYCELLLENGIKNGIILDLACGTGNLTKMLSENGYDCIGVDSSSDMLAIAKGKLENSEVTYICQKIENLDLYGTVSAAVSALDSLNHITDPNVLQKTFNRVSLFLESGGIFIFDMNTVHKHHVHLANNSFIYDFNDLFLAWQNETKGNLTEITLDFFIKSNNKYIRLTENFSERGYDYKIIEKMIESSSMKIISAFDSESGGTIQKDTQRIIYVVKKL